MTEPDVDRIKQLDTLLLVLDSPKEGDEVLFTIAGSKTKYRGVIKKSARKDKATVYEISPKTYPAPKGAIETIEFRGRTFRIGGWQKL